MKAAPDIINQHPDLLILIVGEGALRESLEIEPKKLCIDGDVKFIGPRVHILGILMELDLCVLLSLREVFHLLLELWLLASLSLRLEWGEIHQSFWTMSLGYWSSSGHIIFLKTLAFKG